MRIILTVLLMTVLIGFSSIGQAKEGSNFNDYVKRHIAEVMRRVLMAGEVEIITPNLFPDPRELPPSTFDAPSTQWPLDELNERYPNIRPLSRVICKQSSPPPGRTPPRGGCYVYNCQVYSPDTDHGPGNMYPTKYKFTWSICTYEA
ncbi:MAG: hypothetical protein AB7U41_06805 [Dongiaceae bacterium]